MWLLSVPEWIQRVWNVQGALISLESRRGQTCCRMVGLFFLISLLDPFGGVQEGDYHPARNGWENPRIYRAPGTLWRQELEQTFAGRSSLSSLKSSRVQGRHFLSGLFLQGGWHGNAVGKAFLWNSWNNI